MELKQYQVDALQSLRKYLEYCRIMAPSDAYKRVTSETELAERLGAYGGEYFAINNMPNVPHCCLRLPTGGGKTLLAAHAIKVAQETLIEKDYPVVLWLVTSNTIRKQTVEALKRPGHPYRAVLDNAFQGRVRVFDIAEFNTVRPTDLRDSLAVIVSTIQTLRVTSTEGRKVYAHHEALEPHFSTLLTKLPGLEVIEEGRPGAGNIKFSFANLLHVHRPLMIVDEAHNAVTGLSREVQERVNPCAIVEFTATPKLRNNTVYNVRASELKDADMIKLPIVLGEHPSWQQAVSATIADRKNLEEEAKSEQNYVRPIALFQAEAEGNEVTVNALLAHLTKVENVPGSQIAIATGDQQELDGIDLFLPTEPAIRYIITKQALKEGWDCSFAYVLCSVANISSATDVEQLLGRVMRMPYATKRRSERLNRAYAHVPETRFGAAAASLRDKLITSMGFEQHEAESSIQNADQDILGGEDFFKQSSRPRPKLDVTVKFLQSDPATVEALAEEGIRITEQGSGIARLEAVRPLTARAMQILNSVVPSADSDFAIKTKEFAQECAKLLSPAEHGVRFKVQALTAESQGEFVLVNYETILDNFEWSISDTPARLESNELEASEDGFNWEIDLDGETVRWKQADAQSALPMVAPVMEWTAEQLAIWLDRENRDPAISQTDMLSWTSELVQYLVNQRGLPVPLLHRLKFLISRKMREKVAQARKKAREQAYQMLLFDKQAHVSLSFDKGFEFRENMFFGAPSYRGSFIFRKHFLGADNVGAFDGQLANGEGEEFQCAQALDSLKEVKYWVRNVDRHLNAFKLPLASSNFYPDFVAKLVDGRVFVVEYKGELTAQVAQSRRSVGELWERASGGKYLFLIVEREKDGMDMRRQLLSKLNKPSEYTTEQAG